jgi:hypothetical protein
MTPSDYPLTLYHGDSYVWQFVLWLDAAKTQPLDLTNITPKAEIRSESGAVEFFSIGCTVSLPNVIIATLSADVCRAMPVATYAWDLQLTYGDGQVNTILAGAVTITPDITDSGPPPPPEEDGLRTAPPLKMAPRIAARRR